MMNKPYIKAIALLAVSLISIIFLLLNGPIKQDPGYHSFVDQNTHLSIPDFLNVISNITFLIIGLYSIFYVFLKNHKTIDFQLLTLFMVFFAGVFFTGIGSAYYHYNPSNETLFWDRLPMTISFMAFFSIVICEFISVKTGKLLFGPLLIIGIFSLIYWQITERKGVGDLRLYLLIQFLPILLTIFILLLYQKNSTLYFIQIIFLYALAKFVEMNDHLFFSISYLSGHSIKHLVASAAPLFFLIALYKGKINLTTYSKSILKKSNNKQIV